MLIHAVHQGAIKVKQHCWEIGGALRGARAGQILNLRAVSGPW